MWGNRLGRRCFIFICICLGSFKKFIRVGDGHFLYGIGFWLFLEVASALVGEHILVVLVGFELVG